VPAELVPYAIRPGEVRNPLGGAAVPKDKRELYREARRLALDKSPDAMRRLGELIDSTDERVAVMAAQAILDRAGVRPIEQAETDDERGERFDPSRLTPRQLAQLEAALRLYLKALVPDDAPGAPIRGEIIPPGEGV
jgi:hypothetical protein